MSYFTPGRKILPVLLSYNHTVTVRTLRTSGGNELLNVRVCVCVCMCVTVLRVEILSVSVCVDTGHCSSSSSLVKYTVTQRNAAFTERSAQTSAATDYM